MKLWRIDRRARTGLAGVAVLALDEAPAAAGEDGLPDAHGRDGRHLRGVHPPPPQLHHPSLAQSLTPYLRPG